MPRDRNRSDAGKRCFDVCASVIGMAITAPLQGAVAVVVRRALGTPVLFRQPRPGRDGQVFELVKFRTMKQSDETHVSDEERLTAVGRFLRSTSLDELPTLWNVVKGDMSLVGPRPLRTHYLPLYTPEQARRHEVRPGITGLAQVRGRNLVEWEERFRLDVKYVDNRCLKLDVLILLATIGIVLRRTGIGTHGHVSMSPYRGACDPVA